MPFGYLRRLSVRQRSLHSFQPRNNERLIATLHAMLDCACVGLHGLEKQKPGKAGLSQVRRFGDMHSATSIVLDVLPV
jgi:hypothetical protein